jgi:ubiquinone/menaquinone biosynthesis C-methylase UbiE
MSKQTFEKTYDPKPPVNYQRFFVPAIGAPLAHDLIRFAALRPGERVLDVACGTGVVTRLASKQVGPEGTVAGLDINPGMLAAAYSVTPADLTIEWHESPAEDMPLPDEAFDVVLCQLGLQFMADQRLALKEMRRVLVPGGRLVLNLAGPAGEPLAVRAEELERHISHEAAGFVNRVFSLHDDGEIQGLMNEAGFRDIAIQAENKLLNLPPEEEFLWQYVHSTPLIGAVSKADEEDLVKLERKVVGKWRDYQENGHLLYHQRIVLVRARK